MTNHAYDERIKIISSTPGLITFIDFPRDRSWTTTQGSLQGLPVYLRRIGDPNRYTMATWPYRDDLTIDQTGPLGNALCCKRGLVYAEIPRAAFDGKELDIHGYQSGTVVAWGKFTGQRHMVAGIWDEGGWDPYAGRRQYALFGGMFDSPAVTAHISSTGAASFPQSSHYMSRYARDRALDGAGFLNDEWHCFAMSWNPRKSLVKAWLDGVATELMKTDDTAQDVYRYSGEKSANPYDWPWPIFGTHHFLMKFNGYTLKDDEIAEHVIDCDLRRGIRYIQLGQNSPQDCSRYEVACALVRKGSVFWSANLSTESAATHIPATPTYGDTLIAELVRDENERVGSLISRTITEGAPFTIGRALGLGSDGELIDHGSDIAVDGVAVFDRDLEPHEMKALAFR